MVIQIDDYVVHSDYMVVENMVVEIQRQQLLPLLLLRPPWLLELNDFVLMTELVLMHLKLLAYLMYYCLMNTDLLLLLNKFDLKNYYYSDGP